MEKNNTHLEISMLGKMDGMKAANNDQAIESRGEIEARLGLKAKVTRTETWSRARRQVQRGEVVLQGCRV